MWSRQAPTLPFREPDLHTIHTCHLPLNGPGYSMGYLIIRVFIYFVFRADDVFKLTVTLDIISEGSDSHDEIKEKISEQIKHYRRIDPYGVSAERFSFRKFGGKLSMPSVRMIGIYKKVLVYICHKTILYFIFKTS